MKQTLLKLDWDSDFFKFNVGRIEGLIQKEEDIRNVEFLIEENKIKLSYYSTFSELPSHILKSKKLDIVLVDKKTTYTKNIDANLKIHNSITSIEQNTHHKDKLINLAIQSGIYSRFNIDERIGKEKFEEMYRLWMINSLSRKIAKEVLVFIENNELAGFVTLGEKNNRADIGIIAVDYVFRGKGIGKKLMTSAEKWFSNIGYKSIQVVTQGDNNPACRLYESCGYKVDTVEFFYHFWKK
jgi:dTDP-4-amino-4,6-dideoxy-D-galactose acyltransferase